MRTATVVQVLQDLFLCFIACFILLVIAPLNSGSLVGFRVTLALAVKRPVDLGHTLSHFSRGRVLCFCAPTFIVLLHDFEPAFDTQQRINGLE